MRSRLCEAHTKDVKERSSKFTAGSGLSMWSVSPGRRSMVCFSFLSIILMISLRDELWLISTYYVFILLFMG